MAFRLPSSISAHRTFGLVYRGNRFGLVYRGNRFGLIYRGNRLGLVILE